MDGSGQLQGVSQRRGKALRPAPNGIWSRALQTGCALLLSAALAGGVAAQRPAPEATRVGVVLDGALETTRAALAAFRAEIAAFFGNDARVSFDSAQVAYADWTVRGVRTAVDRLFADRAVDVVVALGALGSHELAHRTALPKPSIAAVVIDATLQGLPAHDGASGVHNLTYIDAAYATVRTLEQFRSVVPFRSLAVLVEPGLPDAIPALAAQLRQQASALGFAVDIVPVAQSGVSALAQLPASTDAVYLGPLDRLAPAGFDSLLAAVKARHLPTFTVLGRQGVERGALAAFAPRDELERRARRTAVDIQRIRAGEDAATLPVVLAAIPELTLNMATARTIGFAPEWQTLIEADLINELPPAQGPSWSVASAAREAMRVHSDVRAAERYVEAGGEEKRRARSALLPQVNFSTTGTMVRDATAAASFGQQPERQLTGSLNFSQVLISDDAWSGYAIAGHQQEGRIAELRRTEMDVALDAATAGLSVLRAQAQARVQRANLRRTRANLELAKLREITGAASLADVYRWQSELATARSSVLQADAQLRVAEVGLNRMLERPLEEPFTIADAVPSDSTFLTSEPHIFDYLGNPETFRVFREFMVGEAVAASPELRQLDASIAAQRRSLRSASRSLWWPTLSLQAAMSSQFARGGAGSTGPQLPTNLGGISAAPDETWSIRFQLSRPVFTGMEREAAKAEASLELERLNLMRTLLQHSIDQQMLDALHVASASWAGIRQAQEAAEAARNNLDLVTDAYARGTVAVISLIDAQQAALNADQRAADATYAFLVDLMRVERAGGEFHFFRSPEAKADLFKRLDAFFRAAGVTPGLAR